MKRGVTNERWGQGGRGAGGRGGSLGAAAGKWGKALGVQGPLTLGWGQVPTPEGWTAALSCFPFSENKQKRLETIPCL